jgi:hypothetical protein
MNALGLAGAELHGIIGFTLLARYRMEIDFKRDKMGWTRLDFEPPAPMRLGKGGAPFELEAMGTLMKFLGFLAGTKPAPEVLPRGFLGLDLANDNGWVMVKSVFPNGPAAQSGLKPGDLIVQFQNKAVRNLAAANRLAAKITAGEMVHITVIRGDDLHKLSFKAGEGL